MLKLGQELDTEIVPLDINGKTVYAADQDVLFIVYFAQGITAEEAESIAEYSPGRIVFTDQCFNSVTDASNVRLTLESKGGKVERKTVTVKQDADLITRKLLFKPLILPIQTTVCRIFCAVFMKPVCSRERIQCKFCAKADVPMIFCHLLKF